MHERSLGDAVGRIAHHVADLDAAFFASLDVDIVHACPGLADQFQVRSRIQEGCRHLRLVDYQYVAVADSFESFLRGAVPVCDKLAESLDRGE